MIGAVMLTKESLTFSKYLMLLMSQIPQLSDQNTFAKFAIPFAE